MQFKVSRYLPTLAYVKVVLTINSETAIHGIVTLERCVIETRKNKDNGKFDRRRETCSINLTILSSAAREKSLLHRETKRSIGIIR